MININIIKIVDLKDNSCFNLVSNCCKVLQSSIVRPSISCLRYLPFILNISVMNLLVSLPMHHFWSLKLLIRHKLINNLAYSVELRLPKSLLLVFLTNFLPHFQMYSH